MVDNFILECCCTHCWLQNLHMQQIGCTYFLAFKTFYNWLERIFYSALCQHLRSVARCRLLTVTSVQTIDELSFLVDDILKWIILTLQDFFFFEVITTRARDKIGLYLITHRMHLYIIFFGIESTVSKQILIDATQLVDAKISV